MTRNDLKEMSRETLQELVLRMSEILSEEQQKALEEMVREYDMRRPAGQNFSQISRMSQAFVDEKMGQIREWMRQIDEEETYLNSSGYEDYSGGYWDREWITEYYDNQGIGDKIISMLCFAKDCIDDRKYQEADEIYRWLWEMEVTTIQYE